MELTEFSSEYKPSYVDVKILGVVNVQQRPAGGKITWKGKAYYNQSDFRAVMLEYQRTGRMPDMDIQVTTEDEASRVGRQTIILKGCLLDSVTLAQFKAGEELLEEDVSGTAGSWEMPEKFTPLAGRF